MKLCDMPQAGRLTVLFTIFLVLCQSGCYRPDKHFVLEDLYENRLHSRQDVLIDADNLPTLQRQDKIPLPEVQDGQISLSLEQAVMFALQRNRALQVERYNPFIAGTFEQLERGAFDPELYAGIEFSDETASEVSRSTGERYAVEANDDSVHAGVRQLLPTGTQVAVEVGYERNTTNRTPDQQNTRLGLSVTQSLLRNFGPLANLVGVRQAELGTEASMYEFRGIVETLLAEVEAAYWQYVLETERIAIFEHSLEIAQQQLREVEGQIEVGVIARNSAAAAKAEVARRQQESLEARSRQSEQRLRLLRLLNVTDDQHFHLEILPTSLPRVKTAEISDLGDRIQLALQRRADLQQARLLFTMQELEVVQTRNGLLPKLELFINLGKTGYADSFSQAWKNIDEENYDLLTGISLSSYLDNRVAKSEFMSANATRDQAKAAIENLENMVQLDVRLAVNEVERTREQIAARSVTMELQEQSLKAEQERFSVGDTTSLMVAQAQRDLLVSQIAEVEAVIAYRIALTSLFKAEGTLLERRGIEIDQGSVPRKTVD